MTDAAIIAASYAAERNYSHNLDNVIDASDAVGAWGTTKESTTELVDLSGNGNIADIHGAMPTEGFIQGRRFTDVNENYLDCGHNVNLNNDIFSLSVLISGTSLGEGESLIAKNSKVGTQNGYGIILRSTDPFVRLYTYNTSLHVSGTGVADIRDGKIHLIEAICNGNSLKISIDGITVVNTIETTGGINTTAPFRVGLDYNLGSPISFFSGLIYYIRHDDYELLETHFNTLARLPFWSVNYTDYPDNTTEYTDNLPYSSSIISSGTFKVDDDKLQCVSAGTMTYSASYDFDGSEYIKVEISGVEYAGTGTITQGNTTVSVAQGSNKITIQMGTGDTIEGEIGIQFREEV